MESKLTDRALTIKEKKNIYLIFSRYMGIYIYAECISYCCKLEKFKIYRLSFALSLSLCVFGGLDSFILAITGYDPDEILLLCRFQLNILLLQISNYYEMELIKTFHSQYISSIWGI